jgi:hypothetical protein
MKKVKTFDERRSIMNASISLSPQKGYMIKSEPKVQLSSDTLVYE